MKKIFIVTGELSGDKVGQWYCQRYLSRNNDYLEGIGGDGLQHAGVALYDRFEKLNVVGLTEIIKKIPFILKFLKKLVSYIVSNNFSQVVLVDFPGFNLMLAKRLKKALPKLKITYVSPPQIWCWGQWRIKKLKSLCDDIVVMYPFEQQWYKQRGVNVKWLGSPVYERMEKFFKPIERQSTIVVLPASRNSELESLFPICAQFINQMAAYDSRLKFILPLASSLSKAKLKWYIDKFIYAKYINRVALVEGEQQKIEAMRTSFLALTKPGTVTLELALLGIPTIMFFKSSWINYCIAKLLVHVKYMALPNLLCKKPLYNEFLQKDCNIEAMVGQALLLLKSFQSKDAYYAQACESLLQTRNVLK